VCSRKDIPKTELIQSHSKVEQVSLYYGSVNKQFDINVHNTLSHTWLHRCLAMFASFHAVYRQPMCHE
jgi:hypothetical protein